MIEKLLRTPKLFVSTKTWNKLYKTYPSSSMCSSSATHSRKSEWPPPTLSKTLKKMRGPKSSGSLNPLRKKSPNYKNVSRISAIWSITKSWSTVATITKRRSRNSIKSINWKVWATCAKVDKWWRIMLGESIMMSSEPLRKIISILPNGNVCWEKKPRMSINASKNSKMLSLTLMNVLKTRRRSPKMKTSTNSSRISDLYIKNSSLSIETKNSEFNILERNWMWLR